MNISAIANLTIYLFVFILGAAVGSFLNVVIYRLPAGISLVSPPSRCPRCKHQLGITENVPIFGWIWLKGKCRWCRSPISGRYPLIELATALIFMVTFAQFGASWLTVGYWVLLSWLIALAMIDLDTMTLPNPLTQSGLVLGLGWRIISGWQQGLSNGGIHELMGGIFAAVLGIWLFEGIVIIGTIALGQAAMGGGDPKLASMIGAWLGWQNLLLTGFVACILGALVGGGAVAMGWISRRQAIPFGPFLVLGAIFSMFWGPKLIALYMDFFFPSL